MALESYNLPSRSRYHRFARPNRYLAKKASRPSSSNSAIARSTASGDVSSPTGTARHSYSQGRHLSSGGMLGGVARGRDGGETRPLAADEAPSFRGARRGAAPKAGALVRLPHRA